MRRLQCDYSQIKDITSDIPCRNAILTNFANFWTTCDHNLIWLTIEFKLEERKRATFNRALNSDRSLSNASSCVPVLPLASMNEYVNIKRQFVSHPPISVQARALHFSLGEKIISGSQAAIFSPNVEQRTPRFTAFGPINDRLQTSVASLRCGRLQGSYYSFYSLPYFESLLHYR